MITLYWSYILIGWIIFALLVTLVEQTMDDVDAAIHDLIVFVFIVIPVLILVIATILGMFLGVAQLLQPYITVTW